MWKCPTSYQFQERRYEEKCSYSSVIAIYEAKRQIVLGWNPAMAHLSLPEASPCEKGSQIVNKLIKVLPFKLWPKKRQKTSEECYFWFSLSMTCPFLSCTVSLCKHNNLSRGRNFFPYKPIKGKTVSSTIGISPTLTPICLTLAIDGSNSNCLGQCCSTIF